MPITRKIACTWLFITAVLALTLPALNWIVAPRRLVDIDVPYLFNTDLVEGGVALALYRAGVSWDPSRVVVGKEGWLFLGDAYEATVRHTRGIETEHTTIRRTRQIVGTLKTNEAWINAQGIPTLFVIAPDKYSVYPEFRPEWIKSPETNFTDRFVAEASTVSLNLLDLRPTLLTHKNDELPLYYKLDSHWNQYAAYLGYRATIDRLNEEYSLQLRPVEYTETIRTAIGGGGTSALIKLNPLLGEDCDVEMVAVLENDSPEVKIQALDELSREPVSPWETGPNRWVSVSQRPHHIVNDHALNDLRVLWLRDSFGNNNSRYFNATFREIWAFHLSQLYGADLQAFIEKEQPDLVLFQTVERSIHGDIFRNPFPDKAP